MNLLTGKTAVRGLASIALAALFSGLTGCTMGTVDLSGAASSPVTTGSISIGGKVHGGEQPVSGSTVQIYLAGNTGYGSGSTTLGTAATTASDGSFTITGINYGTSSAPVSACGSLPATTQAYIVSSGGNPGLAASGGTTPNNTSIYLVAALGPCSALSTSTTVIINEVSTAAFAYAFGNYVSASAGTVGSPNTTQAAAGLVNAYASYTNLYSNTTGLAVTSTTLTGAGVSLVATPESAKLNTVADILASCVQSQGTSDPNSTSCTTLKTSTGSTNFAATGVLASALYIAQNPTASTSLYSLAGGTGAPFPGLAAAPTDFTMGIQFVDNAGTTILKAQNVAVDSVGNVWVLSNANNSSGTSGAGGLLELGPGGTPLAFPTSLDVDGPNTSAGAESSLKTTSTGYYLNPGTLFTSNFNSLNSAVAPTLGPRNLAIDTSNNVWFTTSSSATDPTTAQIANGAVFEYTGATIPSHGFSTGKGAYGLAIDGNNNVFVSQQSSSAYFGFYEFPGGSFSTAIAYPVASATRGTAGTTGANSYFAAQYLTVDTIGNLWATIGTGTVTGSILELTAITANNPCTLTAPQPYCLTKPTTSTTANTYNTVAVSNSVESFGLAAGETAGSTASAAAYTTDATLLISNLGSTTTQENNYFSLPVSATNPPTATATTYGSATTVGGTKAVAVDGVGNVWVGSAQANSSAGSAESYGGIAEFTSGGTALSPASSTVSVQTPTGYNHAIIVTDTPGPTCTSNCTFYTNVGLSSVSGVAIDPSGNVWLANNVQQTAAVAANGMAPGTPAIPSSIYELVGAAAPTVTPIALALKNSTVAAKP